MSPVLSADIIARVKDETDIVEVVRQHVQLKPAGAVFKGLCPFHKEKTPSFIVTPSRGRWHCFGCGTGGDVISFLMEAEGVTFPEAVEILARPLDIDLSSALKEDESEGERRSFHRANETAMNLWSEALWDSKLGSAALAYLTDRGFGEKVLRDYDAGWAPGLSGWLEAGLRQGGVDRELALRADLLRPSDRGGEPFAYFRNRIIFPVKIISRQVAGFGGRVVDQGEPKYLNSSDSAYFNKGKLLYGFEASRMPIARQKCAVLVEGYLDLLALAQVGFTNVVATCGTAFTPEQAKLLRRGARDVILMFDGDRAGLKAAVRSADIALRHGLDRRGQPLSARSQRPTHPVGAGPVGSALGRGRSCQSDGRLPAGP
jgi:DNA primase